MFKLKKGGEEFLLCFAIQDNEKRGRDVFSTINTTRQQTVTDKKFILRNKRQKKEKEIDEDGSGRRQFKTRLRDKVLQEEEDSRTRDHTNDRVILTRGIN